MSSKSTSSPSTLKTYTLQVSLPKHNCWRKIEIKADQTLQELHRAILEIYDFDDDHMFSFFLSNKAWDKKTEYTLPEGVMPYENVEIDWKSQEAEFEAYLNKALIEIAGKSAKRQQLYKEAIEGYCGLKSKEWDAFIKEWSLKLKVESQPLLMQLSYLKFQKSELEELRHQMVSDVRTVTLEDLKLRVNKKFLYLFDYGDEWKFSVQVVSINKNAEKESDFPCLVESFGEAPLQYPNADDDWIWELEDIDDLDVDENDPET